MLALAALARPASADVFVNVDVTKIQDITVTESITKTKTLDVKVTAPITDGGAAEANAIVNISNHDLLVDGGEANFFAIKRTATIDGSVNSNKGIVGVNQDVGNFANQANVVSFAYTQSAKSVADSKAFVEQENEDSTSIDHEAFDPNANMRGASITNSVNGNLGIVGVNQNAGNGNNQTNAVALAVGQGANVALSEAALGQENSNIHVEEFGTVRHEDITGSVNGNTGIAQVNQSNGNFNNQSSVIAFSALSSSVNIGQGPSTP
jgi:hypothetical protein